jgi:hypothetical protein
MWNWSFLLQYENFLSDNSGHQIWLIEGEDPTKFFPSAMVFAASPFLALTNLWGQNGGDAVTWITSVLFHTSLKSVAMKVLST